MRSQFFVAGGTLHSSSPSYVERLADRELQQSLTSGEYCYILDSRQKGKSSLISRADQRLAGLLVDTVRLDLQRYGSNVTAEQWFAGMLSDVGEDLGLSNELFEYWGSQLMFGPLQRFFGALADVVLPLRTRPIVIFVDEIDFVLSLPFPADEFFAGVREFYNRRSEDRKFRRLTFCLAGVATPSSLIRNVRITPFNIGRRIALTDFTLKELLPFASHLGPRGADLIPRIHHWTGGHPYLTQRLCAEIAEDATIRTARDVDKVVESVFFSPESRRDEPNLADVSRRMLEHRVVGFGADEVRTRLLDLYRQILEGAPAVPDDDTDPFAEAVKLSGLTRTLEGRLVVRNRLYATAFDRTWIDANLPDAERKRQTSAYRRGMYRAAGWICLGLLLLGAAIMGLGSSAASKRDAKMKAKFADDEAHLVGSVLHAERMLEVRSLWTRNGRGVASIRALLENDSPLYRLSFETAYYRRLCNLALFTAPAAEDASFSCLTVSGNHTIFAGLADGSVRSWTVEGSEVNSARLSQKRIEKIAAVWGSGSLVAADTSGGIWTWNAVAGDARELLPRAPTHVAALAASPSGTQVYAIGADGSFRNQAIIGGTAVIGRLPTKQVDGAAISSASHVGAYATASAQVCIFDLTTLAVKTRYRLPPGEVAKHLEFSPDGKSLAIAEAESRLRLIETQTGQVRWSIGVQNGSAWIAFSPDGQKLVIGGNDDSLEFVRARDGFPLFTNKGHDNPVLGVAFVGNNRLASVAKDEFKIWEGGFSVETHIFEAPRHNDVTAIQTGRDFLTFVTGHTNGDVCLWRPFRKPLIAVHPGNGLPVSAIAVSEDSASAAFGDTSGAVLLGRYATLTNFAATVHLVSVVTTLAFSKDNRYLAAGDEAGNVAVWDCRANQQLAAHAFGSPISGLAFNPQAPDQLAIAANRLWLVNSSTLNPVSDSGLADSNKPTCVAFSPDGQFIAAADASGYGVKVFDLPKGQLRKQFHGHDTRVRACAFSPDGLRLATTDDDGITIVLDMETEGEVLPVLEFTYPGSVNVTLSFNPNGERLFGGSTTGWSQFWNSNPRSTDPP